MVKAQINSIVKMIKKSRAESGDESNNSAAQTEKKASFQLSSKPEKVMIGLGLAAGLAMADREEPKYGRCTIAAALGCVAYYILYFFKSFAYDGLLMGGLTAATAAAALPLKIPASIFNGAVAIILAPPLCIALRHALKRAHLRLP